jgi:IS5 family transposase
VRHLHRLAAARRVPLGHHQPSVGQLADGGLGHWIGPRHRRPLPHILCPLAGPHHADQKALRRLPLRFVQATLEHVFGPMDRWFCRLGLDGEVPDHSTFSKNRHGRFRDCDLFRRIFERVVRRCTADGLVGSEGFAVDASVVEADASRFKRVAVAPAEWSEPGQQTRAVREYLDALDTEASPNNPEREPRALSPSDPCSAWTTKGRLRVQFAYGVNYLIDTDAAVIIDVQATPARISKEVASTRTMIERTAQRLGLRPQWITADKAYGTGTLLGWLVDRNIDPHIHTWDKSERGDGSLARADFTYDRDDDAYFCPRGKVLTSTGRITHGTIYYRSSKYDCDPCPLKSRCCPKSPHRRIPRDVDEDGRDHARALAGTPLFERAQRERKKVEMLFAHLKRQLGIERLRLRGLTGAQDEFLLAATVQNLKRLARRIPSMPAFKPA